MKLNRDVLRELPLALRIEIEENAQRKPLTQSELAAEQKRILDELRKYKTPGKRTDLETSASDKAKVLATQIVGEIFNEGHAVVEKRLAVVAAAAAEPEKYGKLLADMDRTGRVHGPYKRLKVARQAEQILKEPPPLPGNGPYRVGNVDPAWPYEIRKEDPSHRATHPYPQMFIEQICAFAFGSIMHEDSIVWLWTTNHHMREAFTVLDAWRFEPKTILTWAKDRMGTGDWLRGQTEHAIMGVRGKPIVTLTNQTTLLHAPMRANSQKPAEFYDFVESLCPAPRYCDLFSRYRHNDRWDCHGDEAPGAGDLSIPTFLDRTQGDAQ
jgi:N6-adenosine-specific RNA methylase IME4